MSPCTRCGTLKLSTATLHSCSTLLMLALPLFLIVAPQIFRFLLSCSPLPPLLVFKHLPPTGNGSLLMGLTA